MLKLRECHGILSKYSYHNKRYISQTHRLAMQSMLNKTIWPGTMCESDLMIWITNREPMHLKRGHILPISLSSSLNKLSQSRSAYKNAFPFWFFLTCKIWHSVLVLLLDSYQQKSFIFCIIKEIVCLCHCWGCFGKLGQLYHNYGPWILGKKYSSN